MGGRRREGSHEGAVSERGEGSSQRHPTMAPVSPTAPVQPLPARPALAMAALGLNLRARPPGCTAGEGVECIVCWESFNNSANSPHSLWCGHSLCRECVNGLPSATCTWIPTWSFHVPFLIPCPWCQWVTPRFTWKGSLAYPCKNYSLMWVLDTIRPSPPAPLPEKEKQKSPMGKTKRAKPSDRPATIQRRGGSSASQQAGDAEGGMEGALSGESRRLRISHAGHSGQMQIIRRGGAGQPQSISSIFLIFLDGALLGIGFGLRLLRKLPLICILAFLIIFILPISGFALALYFLTSVFFAIPSSAVAFATISFSNFLVQEILR